VKLLFDHNLSPRLIDLLQDLYPHSNHVYLLGLDQAPDREIWKFAEQEDFLIVTKDADFSDLCLLLGSPPKVIWIRRGNCKTFEIAQTLRQHYDDVEALTSDTVVGVLTLY
jgi:predicted nuclease of predicted toxin-antitoxin system